MLPPAHEQLIVALDVPTGKEALQLVSTLNTTVSFYKVGMQLYFAEGNSFIKELKNQGKKIFLDLKINDIPETVAKAVEVVSSLGVEYLTLFSGKAQIEAARSVITKNGSALKLLNVTVLTSESSDFLAVESRAKLSFDAGAHGLICSGFETQALREKFGKDVVLINPGIRPLGADVNDQVRIVTPKKAIQSGATHLVVGRPISQSANPRLAAEAIQREIADARALFV
ncbi:MAG: Orotidine 5'-phosphate decarboxylase [Turneriella sp.]|nr:Orotidine 5'-phosphate decarboxylase [Turneriella sp.]